MGKGMCVFRKQSAQAKQDKGGESGRSLLSTGCANCPDLPPQCRTIADLTKSHKLYVHLSAVGRALDLFLWC